MENEKRLIDANALRKDTMAMCGVNEAVLENCYPYWQFNKAIVNAPTVDAVDVVRCRDCKYFVQGEPYDPCECMKWIAKFAVAYTEPHGYCHKAERRTNG